MRLASLMVGLVLLSTAGVARAQYGVPEVEVTVAPPAARVEVQPPRPSMGHNWVPGYWSWRGGRHFWVGGHWAVAPQQGMVWEPAHWVQRGPHWRFIEGHWRWSAAPQQNVVYEPAPVAQPIEVAEAPPAPIVEVRPAAPFGGAVWIPGYWHWNGSHHFWVGGRWSAPRRGAHWEPAHWERRGPRHVFIQGHWAN